MRTLTGEESDDTPHDGKSNSAQDLGRKGRAARVENMTPERREEIAKKAAAKRWAKP